MFETDAHRRRFLQELKRVCAETGLVVVAWVLMSDHFHLVVDAAACDLSEAMRLLTSRYVSYFNHEEERSGRLVQGPFYSTPIKDDIQLLATVDYVHRNPERAEICSMERYRWSSFQEYAGKNYLVDTSLVLGLIGSAERLAAFHARRDDVAFVRVVRKGMTDEEAIERAKHLLGDNALLQLRSSQRGVRNHALRLLYRDGCTAVQLARLAEIGVKTVRRAVA